MSQTVWVLIGLSILMWAIKWSIDSRKKKLTWPAIRAIWGNCAQFIAGLYALLYVVFVVGFRAAGFEVNFPTDDTAITIALLLGSTNIVYECWLKLKK